MSGDRDQAGRFPVVGSWRRRGKSRAALIGALGLLLVAAAVAWAQDGLVDLPSAPKKKVPGLTFKPERDANDKRGQEFIRFECVHGTHEVDNGDGTSTTTPQMGTIYQRVSSIDSVGFDVNHATRSMETSVIYLTSGRWYVVTGGVDEVWSRLSDAGPYEFRPAKGEKE